MQTNPASPYIPLDFGYKATNGLTYSNLLIDRDLKRVYVITNASCSAVITSFVGELYGLFPSEICRRFSVAFNGPTASINFDRLPKKYHKFQIIAQ